MLRLPPLQVNGEIVRLPLDDAEAVRLYQALPQIDAAAFPAVREWNRLNGDSAADLWSRGDEFTSDDELPSPFESLFLTAISRLKNFTGAVDDAKLKALYHFAYGMSHEFNNPLANIATRAQALLRDETDPDRRRKLATINAQAFRGHEMLADLMLFAKPPALRRTSCELAALIQLVLEESAAEAREQGTSLVFDPTEEIPFAFDKDQLAAAIKSLVRNALESLRTGGAITIHLRRESSFAIIEIADNGPGIPAEIRPLIFNPFFSGREAGRGLGNGLAKCWKIAELHGGTLTIDSPPTGGAIARIQLPL